MRIALVRHVKHHFIFGRIKNIVECNCYFEHVPFDTPQAFVISSIDVFTNPLSDMIFFAASISFFLVSIAASCRWEADGCSVTLPPRIFCKFRQILTPQGNSRQNFS